MTLNATKSYEYIEIKKLKCLENNRKMFALKNKVKLNNT